MIINENGIDKEVTGAEKEAITKAQTEISAEFEKTENAKKQATDARIAVLTRLGLTEDDFKALGL